MLEEDSTTDDEDGTSLDELLTDEEDSATLKELFSEEDDPTTTSEELLPAAPSLDDDFSPLPLLLDSTLPELDEDFSSLEELPSTAFSLDEDSFGSADCGACPELVEGLSVTLDDELLPGITSSLEEERVASPSAGPAGESLDASSPQALPSNAATTTIPPRTNFFSIKHLTPKYNLTPAPNQSPVTQRTGFYPIPQGSSLV
ncbi:MAG: hypothetical protein MJY99_08745 [Fibrobacter sp.]|nr:hypothetical protein [Fibrobacter sp.]